MASTTPKRDRLLRPSRRSPFEKIIAFDYEDGPTAGLVHDDDRPATYRFDVLAIDVDGVHNHELWDRGEEVRIFKLAQLPSGVFDRFLELLTAVESPRWPIWVPGLCSSSEAVQDLIAREIDLLLETTRADQIVAASSLLSPILASATLPPEAKLNEVDWFAFLGLRPLPTKGLRD